MLGGAYGLEPFLEAQAEISSVVDTAEKLLFSICHQGEEVLPLFATLKKQGLFPAQIVNVEEQTALFEAVIAGNLAIVEFLIDQEQCDVKQRDSHGKTPLHYCIDSSYKAIAEKLINSGASIHAKDN